MAGSKNGEFRELVSPFLKDKLAQASAAGEVGDVEASMLSLQYYKSGEERLTLDSQRRRHYEAEVHLQYNGEALEGVERLYRRTILLEPTTACAAHCRWCIRGYYPTKSLSRDQITNAARYFADPANRDDLNELVLTGGDPLMSLPLLEHAFEAVAHHAPNIRIVRLHTRVPVQDPKRINARMLALFERHAQRFRIELGVHFNHPAELWPETREAIEVLSSIGVVFYNQHPILRGVNDDEATLVELYDGLREMGVEAHYLFHTAPVRGTDHHRVTIDRGLELVRALSSSGLFSGRAKPQYAALTDIGKVTFYEGTIVDRRSDESGRPEVLLRSGFSLAERQRWCPGWVPPESVVLDDEGRMLTWYSDGLPASAQEQRPGAEPLAVAALNR